jgi:histidyl-tRNA synthetase
MSSTSAASQHFEAEMPIVIAEIFEQLPVGDFRVRCNNRKILRASISGSA